jgi:xanthine dehydrogenase accessory factor
LPIERSVYRELLGALGQGTSVVRATIVAAWGSTPREVGAKMLVLPDGQIRGTIGGGCGEAEVWQIAQEVLRDGQARRVHIDLTEPLDSDGGKVCGGRFDVALELWNATSSQEVCQRLQGSFDRSGLRLVTYLGPRPAQQWRRKSAGDPTPLSGWTPGQTVALPLVNAEQPFPVGLLETLESVESAQLVGHGAFDFFVDVLPNPMRLVIAGAGHIARPLCEMAALCGYQVIVVDDRDVYARADLFPSAHEVVCADFTETFKSMRWDHSTSAVLVTRGHKHDEDCLRAIAGQPMGYLGMIGSKRRVRAVKDSLMSEGLNTDWLDSLYAPIGLDIGAQTPEEIAVCILAEMIQVRRGGTASSLRSKRPRRISASPLENCLDGPPGA